MSNSIPLSLWSATAMFLIATAAGAASLDGAFIYQGKLQTDGTPANGAFDFRVHLCTAATGGATNAEISNVEPARVRSLMGSRWISIQSGRSAR